jgi:hypothetical protein
VKVLNLLASTLFSDRTVLLKWKFVGPALYNLKYLLILAKTQNYMDFRYVVTQGFISLLFLCNLPNSTDFIEFSRTPAFWIELPLLKI